MRTGFLGNLKGAKLLVLNNLAPLKIGGRDWTRTSDPYRVKVML